MQSLIGNWLGAVGDRITPTLKIVIAKLALRSRWPSCRWVGSPAGSSSAIQARASQAGCAARSPPLDLLHRAMLPLAVLGLMASALAAFDLSDPRCAG